ncbi:hypothetical protein KY285_026768 [Solanum tuberosum]|nr:hypothetical protein KY285_026768 [Solanum tuberosum]
MALVLRYVNKNGELIESFLGIVHVGDTSARSLQKVIYSLLLDHSLCLSRLRGQGYDGASNMQGEKNGLKSLILQDAPSAYYIHCFAHQLQLTLVALSKKHPDVKNFFYVVTNVLNTIGTSFKRRDLLRQHQVEKLEELFKSGEILTGQGLNQERGLQRPGDTRWGSHFKTLENFMIIFSSIANVLKDMKENSPHDLDKLAAGNLLDKIQEFEFIFVLHLMFKMLLLTNELNQALQKKDQDIVNAMGLLNLSKRRLQTMRESGLESLMDEVSSFCGKHDILIPEMTEDYPRSKRKNFIVYARECDGKFLNLKGIKDLATMMAQTKLDQTWSLVYLLVKLALILPVATASVERAFSSMKLIKNDLRNSIGEEFLNGCLVCKIERKIFENTVGKVVAVEKDAKDSGTIDDWKEKDMLLRSWISGTLTKESMYLTVGCSTAKEMWECLEETYLQATKEKKFQLKQLQSVRLGTKNIDEYIKKFKGICEKSCPKIMLGRRGGNNSITSRETCFKPAGQGTGSQNSQYGPGIIILFLSVFTGGTTPINLQMNYHKQRLDITFIPKH